MESFIRRLRDECLNAHGVMTPVDTREMLESWRRDYNDVRSHGAIGLKVLISLLNATGDTSPPVVTKAENPGFE